MNMFYQIVYRGIGFIQDSTVLFFKFYLVHAICVRRLHRSCSHIFEHKFTSKHQTFDNIFKCWISQYITRNIVFYAYVYSIFQDFIN